jgi:hypothetical protein
MAEITGLGTSYNLPNYVGELFAVSPTETPFLSMIGGLNGGREANSMQFPCSSFYVLPEPTQPEITERNSAENVPSKAIDRGQETNVAQIFQKKFGITYVKMSDRRLSGLAIPQAPSVANEKDFQIAAQLENIAREVENTFLVGVYNLPANENEPYKTRGIIEATKLYNGITNINANNTPLTEGLFNQLLEKMHNAGARFKQPVLFCNYRVKTTLKDLFGYAPQDRNIAGMNLKVIETEVGSIAVVLNRFVPVNALVIADVAYCRPIFVPVPEKGNLFYEDLSKTGAKEEGMLYGQIGLDYTYPNLHGSITNLNVS